MQKMKIFLTAAVKIAVETLVRGLVAVLKKPETGMADSALATMVGAVIKAVKFAGGTEEDVQQIGVLVLCHFGGRSLEVPAEIDKLFKASSVEVEKPAAPKLVVASVLEPTPTAPVLAKAQPVLAPAKFAPIVAPARTLKNGDGNLADKLRVATAALGLKDNSALGQFRSTLAEVGQGTEYWDRCRKVLAAVLDGNLIKEEADWRLLTEKMKRNLFFTDRKNADAFLDNCPKAILTDLLIGQGGLSAMIDRIRTENQHLPSSVYRVAFTIDCCLEVGKEAKELLTNCKHAVNRMKQRQWIQMDHWLVKRVAEMSQNRKMTPPTPIKEDDPKQAVATSDLKLDKLQAAAEAATEIISAASPVVPEVPTAPTELSDAELERLTAPETNSAVA